MFVIRNAQLEALSQDRMAEFVERMVQHLGSVFPEWSKTLDRQELAAFVRSGVARANKHGFTTELEVARYLHVMQALGKTFDESGEYSWARNLLSQSIPAEEKMNRLRDAAWCELEARRIRFAS